MKKDKNKIIIDEITSWKQNQLLPEKYCNFLLALYTYGEGVEEDSKSNASMKRQLFIGLDLVFLFLLLPAYIVIASHLSDQILAQFIVFSTFIFILGIHWYFFNKIQSIFTHVVIVLFFITMLVGSTLIVHEWLGSGFWLNLLIVIQGLIWIAFGWVNKVYYLVISGFIGILLFFALIVI
ncbi:MULTISPECIES: hypothetical protein [Allobacillus]|uniref:DUF2157 domain-containing protein n=1 Tax=Allobacillus salarius TaxID=1955272 RepID=A0A556PTL7_9BACI|nr:hypothetical protein [Allobacillus salarius]TSJ67732.1 hypothetical protein FPQ13_01310 [Allobacillus salarius]